MMLTEESKTDVYPTLDWEGTAGTQAVANEDAVWDNSTGGAVGVATNRVTRPANMGTSGTNGSYSGYVKKTSPGGAIGAAKLLKVMSGDQINTSVDYYWPSATVNNSSANGISTLTTSLLSILANTAGVSSAVKGAIPTVNSGLTADPNIISKITTPENNSSGSTQPKAYLHVLLFNEQFQFDNANSYVQQIGTTANIVATLTQTVTVKRNGYAYIYFSNESNNDVYFDNFKLTDVRGQILQESHYYPFGLTMSGISSQAMSFGGGENKYKFNRGNELQNKEFSDGTGLELYTTEFRSLDPQLGRWWQIDPKPDQSWSPYSSMSDNPISFNDPFGDTAVTDADKKIMDNTKQALNSANKDLEKDRSKLLEKIKKAAEKGDSKKVESLQKKLTNNANMTTSNNTTISNIDAMESDKTQGYTFIDKTGESEGATYRKDGIITMEIVSTANAVHEITHAMQVKNGIITGEGRTTMLHSDLLGEETSAYQAQFAFSPESVQKYVPSYLGPPEYETDINADWIRGINNKQDMTGDFIYSQMLMGKDYDPEKVKRALKP